MSRIELFLRDRRRWWLALALAGALLLAFALLPGDLSPLRLLQGAAGWFVKDGDFEAIDLALYNRLRPWFDVLAIAIVLLGLSAYAGAAGGRPLLLRLSLGLGGLLLLSALLVSANLLLGRRNAQVYRLVFGTPLAYQPVTPTPSPSPTASPVPTSTPVPTEPGRWVEAASPFDFPVVVVFPDDGSNRMFVGVKRGGIRVVRAGETLPVWFLDIRDRVLQEVESPEQGFLGLVLHPDFASNGYFYVNYIDKQFNTVISRFQVSPDDPDQADPDSEHRLFGVHQPAYDHNGGSMAFGPDGYLYIGLGDGGIQRDPHGHAQSQDLLLGKILRIDVDGGRPYAIPPDNPLVGLAGRDEIWAYGLRNPWRFSFDAQTGDMYIGDVGHKEVDEIDLIPAGSPGGWNFGWNHYEGREFYTLYDQPPVPPLANHTPPIWEYGHAGGHCAVTGGYVYRGQALPDLVGVYVYGDYCSGTVWGLRQLADGTWANEILFDTPYAITTFAEDSSGELYIATAQGAVFRLEPGP